MMITTKAPNVSSKSSLSLDSGGCGMTRKTRRSIQNRQQIENGRGRALRRA